MRHIILFDTDLRSELLPITLTRPVSEIRWGIFTNREKWDRLLAPASFSHITSDELEPIFPINIQDYNTLINSSVIPSRALADLIRNLQVNEALMLEGELIAAQLPRAQFERLIEKNDLDDLIGYELDDSDAKLVKHLWEVTEVARHQIASDMELLDCKEAATSPFAKKNGDHLLYIHPTAIIEHASFNTKDGPIYIGPDVLVMDGATIRGPVAINQGSVVKMNASIYGGTVIGRHCVVGGEVKQSLLLDYANKAHEGYLGDSVVGSWCNLGALTSSSNLKNTLSTVHTWNIGAGLKVDTGQLKCGVFLGDFCKTAIHTRMSAGTVVGISAHLFCETSVHGHIASFTWGLDQEYEFDKAIQTIQRTQALKGVILDQSYVDLLKRIFDNTAGDRMQEK